MTASNRTAVITGASTGIGAACALHLDQLGFRVFAGVRRTSDGENLQRKATQRLTPIQLDVTDEKSIAAAALHIGNEGAESGLSCLINNAGIAVAGPLEFLPLSQLRQQFEVNVMGAVGVTQALLPLLRTGQGRIINISSVSGKLASPFVGPYCASKFALEALSDSWRVELKPWHIKVSLIEPGIINTPIWQKSLASGTDLLEGLPAEAQHLYGAEVAGMQHYARTAKGLPPEAVARTVERALMAPHPKARYVVGTDARLGVLLTYLPDRLRDWLLVNRLRQFRKA